jgi:uncharacterized protein YdaU (DUF1376 family)
MNRPWMPLYIADYLRDTANLRALESGAYLHLIMSYWIFGGLPNDDRQLATIAKLTDSQWRVCKPTLSKYFGPDFQSHKRIDAELAKAADISNKRRAAIQQRYNKQHTNVGTNENTLHTSQPTKEVRKKEIRAVANATRPRFDDLFEEFWQAYPRRKGSNPKEPARKKFLFHVKTDADGQAVIAAAKRYAAEIRDNKTDPQFVAQAKTWLNQQRFDDYQPPPERSPLSAPPGAPSDEELREKYGRHQSGISQEDAGGNANGGADHARKLQPASAQVRADFGPAGVSDNRTGDAGMRRLGTILPDTPRRSAACVPDADGAADSGNDGAGPMAGMVRH